MIDANFDENNKKFSLLEKYRTAMKLKYRNKSERSNLKKM
jgi:hypothetical protein